jgi:hypothetical protein
MHHEVESADALCAHLADAGDLHHVVVQGVDLTGCEDELLSASCENAVLLGCTLSAEAEAHVTGAGGIVFPRIPGLPFRAYRSTLYTPDELMEGYVRGDHASFFTETRDSKIYARYDAHRKRADKLPVVEALAQRLHDHAIDDALADVLREDRRVVGVMGGHALARTDAAFRDVVLIGKRLAEAGYFVATGGGPGAMEAANLGAWLAGAGDGAVDAALSVLAPAPTYSDEGFFDMAYAVREAHPEPGAESLAIPTWFYGHEPTNLFATHVAKYFSNSLREDGLLAISTHGIVYAPGSAGTIQEIFMDAAQNHYRTFEVVSAMVFLGERYWTEDKPIRPLLDALSAGRDYAGHIGYAKGPEDAIAFLEAHPPT